MDEDKITITDANYREPMDDKMSREMKEYSAEKLRRAEEKENKMLERAWEKSVKRAEKRKKPCTRIETATMPAAIPTLICRVFSR